jgi:meso-butanediol dehydrogenase / (S,S)-butanediol dehydrogenase / diacetyl reductase
VPPRQCGRTRALRISFRPACEAVDKVVSEFENNERIYGAGVDVSDRDQVAAFVSGAVQRFGKLDGLVNSAGIRGVGNVLDTDPEVWRK